MKDLGSLWYFLGIEIAFSPTGYLLSWSKQAIEILEHARFIDTGIADIPLELNFKYSPTNDTPFSDPTLYHPIVGSLVYLIITCPDITYVVHIVS